MYYLVFNWYKLIFNPELLNCYNLFVIDKLINKIYTVYKYLMDEKWYINLFILHFFDLSSDNVGTYR